MSSSSLFLFFPPRTRPPVCLAAVGAAVATTTAVVDVVGVVPVPPAAAAAGDAATGGAVSVAGDAAADGAVSVAPVATAVAAEGDAAAAVSVAVSLARWRGENGAINACKAAAIADMVLMFYCSKEERSLHNSGLCCDLFAEYRTIRATWEVWGSFWRGAGADEIPIPSPGNITKSTLEQE